MVYNMVNIALVIFCFIINFLDIPIFSRKTIACIIVEKPPNAIIVEHAIVIDFMFIGSAEINLHPLVISIIPDKTASV